MGKKFGRGRGTSLKKRFPFTSQTLPSLPKTFGLIESPMKGFQV